ncbi:RICIN domain-containing protein [Streptomyces sp. NRRL WC-3742]|uniref:RICIN domain-containing protein n=1 Tax=Streptomyces sp. NRRL WC-3742 TaxID=1463934 RepID=UPI0004C4AD93|nr:RICIN domain-containing protein [Streptomyces sp. NRRL WC-3742]
MRNLVRKRHVLGALAAAAIAITAMPGTASANTSGTVSVGGTSKCLDVQASNSANGTPVQIWDCNASGAQNWSGTDQADGMGMTLSALDKCLDVSGSGTADGTRVQLWDCNGSGAQRWVRYEGNVLINPQSGKCLDVPGGNFSNGNQLQLFTCNYTASQQWYFAPPRIPHAG